MVYYILDSTLYKKKKTVSSGSTN